jgi:beta-glucosidase
MKKLRHFVCRFWLIFGFLMPFVMRLHAQSNQDTEIKINDMIRKMTLEEKVDMIHANSAFTSGGVDRLGIPGLTISDGPNGVRPEQGKYWVQTEKLLDSGTYLPPSICLAATWNPELGYAFGSVLGSEANFRGKDIILGPGINIIRSPLNGRNFEYQSEDPFLISRMVVGYINGVQDQGISACVKHFAANNQETDRNSIDVEMSERALREIYLPGFKAAVTDAHVNTLMGAYNKFRGQWCTHNDYLINKILKHEWNFDGAVISDWGGVHSTSEALINGTDLEMGTDLGMLPHPDYHKFFLGDTVIHLVKSGAVQESLIDEKVRRILRVMYKTHVIDRNRKKGFYNTKEHQQTALRIAEEGIVLLKNEDHILPLNPSTLTKVAVIGLNASRLQSMGGGSSQVRAFYEVTPLQGLKNLVGTKVAISYCQGYNIFRGAKADAGLIREAAVAASKADVAIIFGGWTHGFDYKVWGDNAYDAESVDKPDMNMPFGQDELIRAVLKANPKTILVLIGGGAIDMTPWIGQTKGIIQAWYPGMEGGNALAKIIFGQVNPSGKLPMTWPKKLEDCGAHKLGEYPGNGTTVHYNDDIYVGYRYYDTYKVDPQFAFGYGLSYTSFEFSNLKMQTDHNQATVSFTVTNTGKMAGGEVAQVYVKQEKSSLPRPEKELKGFNKIFLKPGEKKLVQIQLDETSFQYYNDKEGRWVLEPGLFEIMVGNSSRSILLKGDLKL